MVNQLVQRLTNLDFKQLINLKKKLKVYIYPNLQGLLLGLFVFFCFLISVFYENNSGLLISIVIFFIFFISIFISHQNINNLRINFLTEYLVEANKTEHINFKIINDAKEKKLNIDLEINKSILQNFNLSDKIKEFNIKYNYDKRGVYSLNKIILKSIYPFGIIRTKINYQPFSKVYVFPQKLIPNQELLQEFKIHQNNNSDEFDGIDEYKKGDSYSKIAWKKSTIGDKKFVKEFKSFKSSKKSILDLNKYNHIEFEKLLSYSVFILDFYFTKSLNLTFKHKDNLFHLNENKNSLNKILKYISNVKN
jgi:uncharacterized protein (DUF58 family)